jgi:hypothetical protein
MKPATLRRARRAEPARDRSTVAGRWGSDGIRRRSDTLTAAKTSSANTRIAAMLTSEVIRGP